MDVETDGPIPGPDSMLSFGSAAYLADKTLIGTFSANLETIPGASADPKNAAGDEIVSMRYLNRKSDPKVIGGLVQKKNNWAETPNYYSTDQMLPTIDRRRPGKGFRHLLKRKDIEAFIGILPDWDDLSVGLNAIVLAPGDPNIFGYHTRGVVHVCAWQEQVWIELSHDGFEVERPILEKLRVPSQVKKNKVVCKFNEGTARAHQLLATFLHELGHHHDRMTTRAKISTGRGESYAEDYARRYAERIWMRYQEVFGVF